MKTLLTIFWTPVLFVTIISHEIQANNHPSLAIARTFAPADVDLLPESFDQWRLFPPCQKDSPVQVDLFLIYSQSLTVSIQAQTAIRAVEEIFGQDEEWSRCISRVIGVGVELDPTVDLYLVNEQSTNLLWVNGPNRQFERTIRFLQDGKYNKYDLMFLMEIDSVPVEKYWLDSLMHEIQESDTESSKFAILGR